MNKKIIAGIVFAAAVGSFFIWSFTRAKKEYIQIDKKEYVPSEYISWAAYNLKVGQEYKVALIKGMVVDFDTFIADTPIKAGSFYLRYDLALGSYNFALIKDSEILDQKEILVKSGVPIIPGPPPPPKPGPGPGPSPGPYPI